MFKLRHTLSPLERNASLSRCRGSVLDWRYGQRVRTQTPMPYGQG